MGETAALGLLRVTYTHGGSSPSHSYDKGHLPTPSRIKLLFAHGWEYSHNPYLQRDDATFISRRRPVALMASAGLTLGGVPYIPPVTTVGNTPTSVSLVSAGGRIYIPPDGGNAREHSITVATADGVSAVPDMHRDLITIHHKGHLVHPGYITRASIHFKHTCKQHAITKTFSNTSCVTIPFVGSAELNEYNHGATYLTRLPCVR